MSFRATAAMVLFLLLCAAAGWQGGRLSRRFDLPRDAREDLKTRRELVSHLAAGITKRSLLEWEEHLAARVALPRAPLAVLANGNSAAARQFAAPSLLDSPWTPAPLENFGFSGSMPLDLALVLLTAYPLLLLFTPAASPELSLAAGPVGVLVALGAASPDFSSPGLGIRLLFWLACAAAYGWFWLNVRAALEPRGERWLLGAYAALVLILPVLPGVLASPFFPSAAASDAGIRKTLDQHEQKTASALAAHYHAHPGLAENADLNGFDRARLDDLRERNRLAAPAFEAYRAGIRRHHWIAEVLRAASPAALLQGALLEAAGTGSSRVTDFQDQMRAFSSGEWTAFFRQRAESREPFTPATLEAVPKFTYREQPVTDYGSRVALCLLALLLWTVAARVFASKTAAAPE